MCGSIKMDGKRNGKGVDLIHLTQYKDRLWAVVNTLLKFSFYEMWKLSTLPDDLAVSHVKLVNYLVGFLVLRKDYCTSGNM